MALGLAAVAEMLLVMTGFQKLLVPAPAAGALRSVGLRAPQSLVRLGAGTELVAGAGALASGWPVLTAAAALCYGVFGAFIAIARRRPEPVSSCGCFGAPGSGDTPPTRGHLAFNVAAATACLAATGWPSPGVVTTLNRHPLTGVCLLGLVALGCWLAWILLAVAPRTAAMAAAAPASNTAA